MKAKNKLYNRIKQSFEKDLANVGINMTYEEWLDKDLKGWQAIGKGKTVKNYFGG